MMTNLPFWRVLSFNLALACWTTLIGLAFAPASVFSRRMAGGIVKPWTSGALWLAKHICQQTFEVRGTEHILFQNMVIASKHQSAFEIIILFNMFPNARFILKRELLFIPIFGQYLWRMGMVHIRRSKRASAMDEMLQGCRTALRRGHPLIIFPEGTRMPAGVSGKYMPGVALLYDQLKLPVLPVAVNTGVFWPKNRWKKNAGKAVIEFLPVIPAGEGIRPFLRQLEQCVETQSKALYIEAIKNLEMENNSVTEMKVM
jgi:1-acyl-sn-glycerol-3-phosphate acyltransferase